MEDEVEIRSPRGSVCCSNKCRSDLLCGSLFNVDANWTARKFCQQFDGSFRSKVDAGKELSVRVTHVSRKKMDQITISLRVPKRL